MTVGATKVVKIWARAELHVLAWILSLITPFPLEGFFYFRKAKSPADQEAFGALQTGVQGGLVVRITC